MLALLCIIFRQGFCFGKSGEALTLKLRLEAFISMMKQVSYVSLGPTELCDVAFTTFFYFILIYYKNDQNVFFVVLSKYNS